MESPSSGNRLRGETSPYLLQHANNPVDWYPWCDAAFAHAVETNRPVLLSIGYSACHWCHVMAHESFEDPATAALMNRLFVNVKVDREERPDVDRIYQTAHQLLTQRGGGWPLTMFLDPATQRPFFGGTYFPREARYGMPAFHELLDSVASHFHKHRDDVRAQGVKLDEVLQRLEPAAQALDDMTQAPFDDLRTRLERSFDPQFGGFSGAPKFPHPTTIDWLLRHWRKSAHSRAPDVDALFMATLTLTRMAEGGIFDHLGGGFCRYSVDRYWQIPHFEKMLYDNGALLATYANAFLATGEALFKTAATRTADWLLEDMRAPCGGFYSSRDADSEGAEGRYYVWTPDAVRSIVSANDYPVFARRYGLDGAANFEGHWHLAAKQPVSAIASEFGQAAEDVEAILERCRRQLFAARQARVPPARDEKLLTAWNALTIRGLAIAGRALGRDDLIDAADDAVEFVRAHLYVDGRLRASFKDDRARFSAYLDDHAFLIDAVLELLQSRWNTAQLNFATELADLLLRHFQHDSVGGFFFTAADHENLMHRPKPLADEATPSGNGVAAWGLQRLGLLLGESEYVDAAERALRSAWQAMAEYPHGHVTLLSALLEHLSPPEFVIIRGSIEEAARWRAAVSQLYAPQRLIFAIDSAESGLPGALAARAPVPDATVAYRCVGTHCELPVTALEALAERLSEA